MSKEYSGWNCQVFQSGPLELLVTLDVGPRIISLTHESSENLFYVIPADAGQKEGDSYRHYGGHRLWTTPEDLAYTYHIENIPVKTSENWFASAPDPRGIEKSFKITPIDYGFKVEHRLANVGTQEVETSPWAITMLNPGGFAVFPNEPEVKHGSTSFLPVRSLSLWSYTKMYDQRLVFGEKFTRVSQVAGVGSFKIGAFVSEGWAAYVNSGLVFHKTFKGTPDHYPDLGANFEIYTDDRLLETETTGTVRLLKPGDSVKCEEIWQVFRQQENWFEECREKAGIVRHLIS